MFNPVPFACRRFLVAAVFFLALPLEGFSGGLAPWPLPNVPPGANAAIIASPRNDWMVHFERNIDRVKDGHVDLVFDGDSITDRWQDPGKDVWRKYYGKLAATDFGISADRTENVLWRLEDGQVDGLHPKLIALMIGTNNFGRDTDEQIAAGIEKIVQAYRQRCPEAAILLQGIFPRGMQPNDPYRQRIRNVNVLISKLGDEKKVIYLDFGDKFLQPDGTLSADIMPDGLHPSAKGYEIWAAAIAPVIEKIFQPAPPPVN